VGQVLVWIDAQTSMRELVARIRAEPADYVVLFRGTSLYAFRPAELVPFGNRDAPAYQVLGLGASNASRRGGIDPRPPQVTRSFTQSELRTVYVDATGRPTRVVDSSTASSGVAATRSAEGTSITRYPSINATLPVDPGAEVILVLDLEQRPLESTSTDPVKFDGLPESWKEFPVTARVSSPQLEFSDGDDEGTIRVRRDQPSVKCRLVARRRSGVTDPIDVTATFFHDDRWCGAAQRTFAAPPRTSAVPPTSPPPGTGASLHSGAAVSPGAPTPAGAPPPTGAPFSPGASPASSVPFPTGAPPPTGALAIVPGAQAPDLTVHIHRTGDSSRRLVWILAPAAAHRALVRRASAETPLAEDPGPYIRGQFQAAAGSRPGEHVSLLQGIGERLWELAPQAFHDGYWAMRGALGDGFTIQFITDEPYIPWELMRPLKDGEETRLLAETHPVARGFHKYPDRLRPVLPMYGEIVTVAPDYTKRRPPVLPPLVAAGEESAMLQTKFRARAVAPASARRVIDELADRNRRPVRILHFSGHGRVETPIDSSHLACEDGDVSIAQVRRQETRLGESYKTFVFLNACEVGAAGDALGAVGGWAEAFAYRNFSGFIAPLWAVFDDHAKLAMESFFEAVLVHGKPVGEALRDMRATYGQYSPTFLSYVYYGDVNARFG
jgi:hypothetical protein